MRTAFAAGATLTIQDDDIAGYAAGLTEAVVQFYRVVPAQGGGYRADAVRDVTIAL